MNAISLSPKAKLLLFVLLLALFAVVAGPDFGLRLTWRLFLTFAVGSAIALWSGRQQISMFRLNTLTFWCVLFGAAAMAWAFAMLLFIRFR